MIRVTTVALVLFAMGLVAGACGGADAGNDDGSSEGAGTCEHGTYSPCACSDGSMGTQLCAHDTSGFEECMCGATDDADDGPATTPSTDDDSGSADDDDDPGTTSEGSADETSSGPSTDPSSTTDGTETGSIGAAPTAMINHPGEEDRQAGVPIPFIGVATDPEDGMLSGMSMVWTDDLEGEIGEGEQFDYALVTLGAHTVTLTATDSDGNVGEATLTFTIVP